MVGGFGICISEGVVVDMVLEIRGLSSPISIVLEGGLGCSRVCE